MSVAAELERSRVELLDLSTRNRLLSVLRHRKATRTIEIVDESSAEILRLLMVQGRSMTFGSVPEKRAKGNSEECEIDHDGDEDEDYGELPQPDDDPVDERGIARRHSDNRL